MGVDAVGPPSGFGGAAPQAGGDPRLLDRLALQLNTVSELLETLTVRVLELEERLDAHQQAFETWKDLHPAPPQTEMAELRLEDTEDRLSRMEALLQGLDQLHGSPPPPSLQGRRRLAPEDAEPMDAPFEEEEQQPFMDEMADQLTA
ncbi:hypothetical protein [Cyanobium sp. NIES-981]|uniref:hypothetical protein n=1 Tax=Cyanobium sp. NIES-981 TaxID=1851505 RepID=UPI0007DCEB4A|nr:hypothetical protein [Cyanobium sp. NIES-981]SBO43493.1 conserved protein of unknown function [Cyanobium sp. NIES-981]